MSARTPDEKLFFKYNMLYIRVGFKVKSLLLAEKPLFLRTYLCKIYSKNFCESA